MRTLRVIWMLAALAVLSVLGTPQPAAAVPVELGLAIDGSGSINAADFALQRDAYANVLANPAIVPQDGSVAVGVWLFSTGVVNVVPMTTVTPGTIAGIIAAINAMVQPAATTAIGDAITAAAAGLLAFDPGDLTSRELIDVSTDGMNNTGSDPDLAAAAAVAAGINAVNCLGIGAGADCSFTTGVGSFSIQVAAFADFQTALERKIARETGQVPAPPTVLLLLGSGLLGMALGRRRN